MFSVIFSSRPECGRSGVRRARSRRTSSLARRGGSVVALLAVMAVVLFGMVAFALDTGYIANVRTELQRTADACALAAAARLPDDSAARLVVRDVAIANGWDGVAWGLEGIELTLGYWNRNTATFTSPAPANKHTNAARVTLRRTAATMNPVRLFFGPILGTSEADVTATATAIYDHWLCGPFVGIQSVSVPGTPRTDSFDSTEGWYVSTAARDRGSVCSDGPINIDGNAVIRGDARAGKGYDVTITGTAQVTGDIGNREIPLNLPATDATQAASINDNAQVPLVLKGNSWVSPVDAAGNFLLDGNKNINLPQGTYFFRDFTLAGNSVLTVSGPTTIYVTGNLYRGGLVTVNNLSNRACNLQIIMTGGTAAVTSGNDFYGVIYAPNTDVTVDGSADLYGAIVGKTLTLTGTGAGHYDESLKMEQIEFPKRTALVD